MIQVSPRKDLKLGEIKKKLGESKLGEGLLGVSEKQGR